MTDLGGNHGPKESDNKDKSLHGLVVALAMAGIIAGSVILFAYASSDPVVGGAAGTSNDIVQPEKPASAEVIDEQAPAGETRDVDSTARLESPTYDNAVTQSKESTASTEVDLAESMSMSEGEEEPTSTTQREERDEPDSGDEPDSEEQSGGLLGLLDNIIDSGDDEKPDKEKGKDHKG